MTIDIAPVEVEAPPRKTVSDILLAAARYIEEHGWYQGFYQGEGNSACAIGAINRVCHGEFSSYGESHDRDDFFDMLCGQAYRHLRASIGDAWASVPDWNDSPVRTAAEVTSKMKEAASS